ncbi:MAG TPA: AgmX/PglI C-terminal domain-containing protein [Byssovorax sp.]
MRSTLFVLVAIAASAACGSRAQETDVRPEPPPARSAEVGFAIPVPSPAPTGGDAAASAHPDGGGVAAQASSVVASMAPAFRRCYNAGLADDPTLQGSVRITAHVGPKGDVTSVKPSKTTLPADVVACVAKRVAAAQFSPPEGGGATVVVPVSFVPQ